MKKFREGNFDSGLIAQLLFGQKVIQMGKKVQLV